MQIMRKLLIALVSMVMFIGLPMQSKQPGLQKEIQKQRAGFVKYYFSQKRRSKFFTEWRASWIYSDKAIACFYPGFECFKDPKMVKTIKNFGYDSFEVEYVIKACECMGRDKSKSVIALHRLLLETLELDPNTTGKKVVELVKKGAIDRALLRKCVAGNMFALYCSGKLPVSK